MEYSEIPLLNFKETVYKHNVKKKIVISCTFKLDKTDKERIKNISKNLDSIKYSITINKENMIEKEIISTSKNKEILIIESGLEKLKSTIVLKKSNFIAIPSDLNISWTSFSSAVPLNWVANIHVLDSDTAIFCNEIKEILRQKFQSIFYLSPNRRIPEWYSDPRINPADVGLNGQNTSVKLHYIFSDRNQIFEDIEKWLKKFDPEIKMLRSPLVKGNTTIEFKTLLTDVNILTTGYGLNALFPIIVQSFISNPESTILIEEPEIHLHTGSQKVIMDMFVELINENKQFILTTHSYDLLMDCYEKVRSKRVNEDKIIRWDIKRKKDSSRVAKKTDVYQYEFSGHGGWRENMKHLTERPS